jgi:hypothetical protein
MSMKTIVYTNLKKQAIGSITASMESVIEIGPIQGR